MDLWVVAAAAGAGYLATHWNRPSKNSDNSCQLSSEDPNFENSKSQSRPLHREAWGDKVGKDFSSEQRVSSHGNLVDDLSTVEAVTPSKVLHCGKLRHGNYDESTVLSISNLPILFSPNENLDAVEDGNEQTANVGVNYGALFPDSSAGEVGPSHHSSGSKTSLRTKHLCGHLCRPLNSLESCLMAQIYKEHCKMEEYVFSSLPSPSTSTPTRSFLISDGSEIISRSNHKSFSASTGKEESKWHKEAYQANNESAFGIPSLPRIRSLDDHPKKPKHKAGKWQSGSFSSSIGMILNLKIVLSLSYTPVYF